MREKDEDGGRDAHEPHARQEPARPHEHEHTPSHAGNGTVNDSPDELGSDGLDSDELELRRMLHRAVQDVEPRDGALEHLRRAVPARRARKRQAVVGMAAAALFVGTAVPALVHVSRSTGSDANPAIAGQASEAHGGTGRGKEPTGGESGTGGSPDKTTDKGGGGGKDGRKDGADTGTGPVGGPDDPSADSGGKAPACTATQLGSATATAEAPDSAGVVHGTFHIVNVSSKGCSVGGPGEVSHLAQGAADDTRISVADHVAGDAAAGLPDPSTEAPGLLLPPGAAYEVKFAWVPSQTCPTTGDGSPGGSPGGSETGDPSPDPTPTQGASATGTATTGSDSGLTPQTFRADGPADGSVVVSYTAEAGSPTVSTTVSNACAGTIYRTGVLAAP
jgi:hypothetical protein